MIEAASIDLLGQQVCIVHRPEHIGTVVEILPGCNTLLGIVFDGRDFTTWLPVNDVTVQQ